MSDDYFRAAMKKCTVEEEVKFINFTLGLPERSPNEPYHCGPYNLKAFEFALLGGDWDANPSEHVLELGFNLGHSAACFLELGARSVVSLEARIDDRVMSAMDLLARRHYPRFLGLCRSTRDPVAKEVIERYRDGRFFDLAFVDAAHDEENVYQDIALCLSFGINRFLLDDWHPHWGPGVQAAAARHDLVPIAVFGAMAYCVTDHDLITWKEEP